jgi:hypothetical protein
LLGPAHMTLSTGNSNKNSPALRFLVVEDDPAYADYLEAMINSVCPENGGIVKTGYANKAVDILCASFFDGCFFRLLS